MPFVAMVSFSAKADRGDFMRRLSVQPAGMTAFNIFEPSLSTAAGQRVGLYAFNSAQSGRILGQQNLISSLLRFGQG